jgi:hypothetical protein
MKIEASRDVREKTTFTIQKNETAHPSSVTNINIGCANLGNRLTIKCGLELNDQGAMLHTIVIVFSRYRH